MDWFIGDTHFGHKNIIEYEQEYRPFASVEEMNEALVSRWNEVVGDDDRVFHLGDVAFSNQYHYLCRLKGRRIVIALGNHDYPNKIRGVLEQDPRIEVAGAMPWKDCILTHIPVHPAQLEYRFKYNIHGHLHSKKLDDKRYINVSCEQNNLYPISWDELKSRYMK